MYHLYMGHTSSQSSAIIAFMAFKTRWEPENKTFHLNEIKCSPACLMGIYKLCLNMFQVLDL